MKKVFVVLFCSLFLVAFTKFRPRKQPLSVPLIESQPIKVLDSKPKVIIIKIKDHNDFLNAIGHQESRNRYHIVNRYGYMGKYQFGKSTLKTLRIKVSRKEFLKDTLLQEEAMLKLLLHNKKRLQKYINKYEGKVVHGILVTESGLLAAAHLGGQGSVKKWFRNGRIRKDGNGVKITSYMKRFGGYILNL
jgi:hypothetical protein